MDVRKKSVIKTTLTLKPTLPKMLQCSCRTIVTQMFLTSCLTKSLPIQDTIRLHCLSWLSDRGFHHVSLLVHEAAQRNNPPLWETHQSRIPRPTVTARSRNNGSRVARKGALEPELSGPGCIQQVITVGDWIRDSSNTERLSGFTLCDSVDE